MGIPVFAANRKKAGVLNRHRGADRLIHSTADNKARSPLFDREFPYMPAYIRRAIAADALGKVSSYISDHAAWEAAAPKERGQEPSMDLPDRYALTFYRQERDLCDIGRGIIGLKLYDGIRWDWYFFRIGASDAKAAAKRATHRKMLSLVVEKVNGRYRIRFSFREERDLIPSADPLSYRVLAVDLGLNTPAYWCVMTSDGTVRARGVIRLRHEEDRLRR